MLRPPLIFIHRGCLSSSWAAAGTVVTLTQTHKYLPTLWHHLRSIRRSGANSWPCSPHTVCLNVCIEEAPDSMFPSACAIKGLYGTCLQLFVGILCVSMSHKKTREEDRPWNFNVMDISEYLGAEWPVSACASYCGRCRFLSQNRTTSQI